MQAAKAAEWQNELAGVVRPQAVKKDKGLDLNLFAPGERAYEYSQKIPNDPNVLMVGGHGNEKTIGGLDAKALAAKIRESPKWQANPGMPVQLIGCNTGSIFSKTIADDLANELGAQVTAPNLLVWYGADGSLAVETGIPTESGFKSGGIPGYFVPSHPSQGGPVGLPARPAR